MTDIPDEMIEAALALEIERAIRDVTGGCYSPGVDCEHGNCACYDKSLSVAQAAFKAVKKYLEDKNEYHR